MAVRVHTGEEVIVVSSVAFIGPKIRPGALSNLIDTLALGSSTSRDCRLSGPERGVGFYIGRGETLILVGYEIMPVRHIGSHDLIVQHLGPRDARINWQLIG